jgi:hypothetical protein
MKILIHGILPFTLAPQKGIKVVMARLRAEGFYHRLRKGSS